MRYTVQGRRPARILASEVLRSAPKKKKAAAANLRSWRIIIMRSRGEYLGSVEAPDRERAEAVIERQGAYASIWQVSHSTVPPAAARNFSAETHITILLINVPHTCERSW